MKDNLNDRGVGAYGRITTTGETAEIAAKMNEMSFIL
jgi:hypothetical protein